MKFILIIVYSVLFAILISTCYIKNLKRYYTLAKAIVSSGFVAIAVIGGITLNNISYLYTILPALIFCLCGDVLLGLYTQLKHKNFFLGGIFAFTMAHIAYTFALSDIAKMTVFDFILPVICVFVTNQLTKMENMFVEKEFKKYTLVYSFFVTLLLSKGIGVLAVLGFEVKSIIIFTGSLFFLISDFIIFFLYFYKKKHHLVGTFNLLFYYAGMLLLTLSVWY